MINKEDAIKHGVNIIDTANLQSDSKQELINNVKHLLPNIVNSDNQIDVKALNDLFDITNTTSNNQGYELTFAGKGLARAKAGENTTLELKIQPKQSKDFDNTGNVIIRGDNINTLKILYANYHSEINMIYIDPPYNTKSENFIYNDNFKKNDEELINEFHLNEETSDFLASVYGTRSHSGWLSFMYPRLMLAKDLLSDDGVIFISIDNNEQANLKIMCDEIFGEDGFVTTLHVEMSTTQGMKVKSAKQGNIVKNAEYIHVYSKSGKKNICNSPLLKSTKYDNHYSIFLDKNQFPYREIPLQEKIRGEKNILEELEVLSLIKNKKSAINIQLCYQFSPLFKQFIDSNANDIVRTHDVSLSDDIAMTIKDNDIHIVTLNNREYMVVKSKNGEFYQKIPLSDKLSKADDFYKTYGPTTIRGDWWEGFYLDMGNVNKEGGIEFDNGKKPIRLIKQIIKLVSNKNDIILDFFAGSGTTAHAVMQLNAEDGGNRKFILAQLDEEINPKTSKPAYDFCQENGFEPVISSITIERVNRAGDKIKLENPDKNIDIGYKVFSLTERPTVDYNEETKSFNIMNKRKNHMDTLINMLVATCKTLDSKIEEIKKNAIYKAGGEIYIIDIISEEELSPYNNLKVNIDSLVDFSLEQYLNLDLIKKDNVTIIY